MPEQHYSVQNRAAAAVDLRTWWTSFNDPILSGLVASVLSAKKDIDAALALRARAALLPVIGIVFGFFQGRRAASLNPIDALRHE